jgi:hypothetical protein
MNGKFVINGIGEQLLHTFDPVSLQVSTTVVQELGGFNNLVLFNAAYIYNIRFENRRTIIEKTSLYGKVFNHSRVLGGGELAYINMNRLYILHRDHIHTYDLNFNSCRQTRIFLKDKIKSFHILGDFLALGSRRKIIFLMKAS